MTTEELQRFLNGAGFQSVGDNDRQLDSFTDPFATDQQKIRDRQITVLLNEYVTFYKKKVKHSVCCRYIILVPCVCIIIGFAFLLGKISLVLLGENGIQTTDLVAFVTACISFISLIIGLLTIITKYFFPEDDEKYITTIVQSIQENDLENKRENAKNSSH